MSACQSAIALLGVPSGFGETVLTFSFILLVAPYLSGLDFGIFKIPKLPRGLRKALQLIGPGSFIVSVLLFLPVLETAASRNRVRNGGVELGPTPAGRPLSWAPDSLVAGSRFTWDTAHVKSGSRSIKIESSVVNHARWFQPLELQPNTTYQLSGWVRAENIEHTPESVDWGANIIVSGHGVDGPATRQAGILGSKDWTYFEALFRTRDTVDAFLLAEVGAFGGQTRGTAWFDDLDIARVSSERCF